LIVIVGRDEEELARALHPFRATVEALTGKRAVAGVAPILLDLNDALPIQRGEFAIVNDRIDALVGRGRCSSGDVNLLKIARRTADEGDRRHLPVVEEQAQTNWGGSVARFNLADVTLQR
jgi:hypothetical protein